jgi:hypothetical protein
MSKRSFPTTFPWGDEGPWRIFLFLADLNTESCPFAAARPFDDSG